MSRGRIIKIIGLNSGIIGLNIILFSPGFIGIDIGGTSVMETAFGATVLIMSVIIFILGNYMFLIKKEPKLQSIEIETEIECIEALKQNSNKKTFSKDINILLEQIKRLDKKKHTVMDLLLQKFNNSEMSYSKFQGVIQSVESLFLLNIKSVINKLNIFDQDDYDYVCKDYASSRLSEDIIIQKMNIYNEYISFVKDSIEDNEQILLKLDKLLLEISKFNSLDDGELEDMDAMKEIDDLISKTKFYK